LFLSPFRFRGLRADWDCRPVIAMDDDAAAMRLTVRLEEGAQLVCVVFADTAAD